MHLLRMRDIFVTKVGENNVDVLFCVNMYMG